MLAPTRTAAATPAELQALFAEARRHRRRRRLAAVLASIVLAGSGGIGLRLAWPHQAGAAAHRSPEPARRGPAVRPPAAAVAWVDYRGRLHLGDLRTMRQRVVAKTTAYPVTPLVQAGGGIYWVDTGGEFATVRELDPATGKITDLGFGQSVFPSQDGRHVFIAQTSTSITEMTSGPSRPHGTALTVPRGWYLPGGEQLTDVPAEVAGGITVQSAPEDTSLPGRRVKFAVWNPATGLLREIGTGFQIIGAASSALGHGGLLALRLCLPPGACPIRIIGTSAQAGVTVRSPLRYGFAGGGALSPDGTRLAVFVNTGPAAIQPSPAQLAIVRTRSGVLRLIPGARFPMGEDIAWARWLPGGQLIAGGTTATYLVNPATLSIRPLYFSRGSDHYIEDSHDVNFSAVILPRARPW